MLIRRRGAFDVLRFGTRTINICMFPSGWNVLHVAARKGDEQMVKGLVDAGACPAPLPLASVSCLISRAAGSNLSEGMLD